MAATHKVQKAAGRHLLASNQSQNCLRLFLNLRFIMLRVDLVIYSTPNFLDCVFSPHISSYLKAVIKRSDSIEDVRSWQVHIVTGADVACELSRSIFSLDGAKIMTWSSDGFCSNLSSLKIIWIRYEWSVIFRLPGWQTWTFLRLCQFLVEAFSFRQRMTHLIRR